MASLHLNFIVTSGPEVIKLFSCSTQLSMKFFPLINVKMPTILGISTFMSRKNSIHGLSVSEKAEFLDIFYTCEHLKFQLSELSMEKSFITSGPGLRVVYEASVDNSIIIAVSVKTLKAMKCFRISYCVCYKFLI